MKKINFKNLEVQTSFEGTKDVFDTTKVIGNLMMYNGSVLLDIGFEDLAKRIYYSDGEVDIPNKYVGALSEVIKNSNFIAAIKRELINKLTNKEEE